MKVYAVVYVNEFGPEKELVDIFYSREEAEKAIERYKKIDKEDGIYGFSYTIIGRTVKRFKVD